MRDERRVARAWARVHPVPIGVAPMTCFGYPSDLTDAQWKRIEPLIPNASAEAPSRTTGHCASEPFSDSRYRMRSAICWRVKSSL